MRWLKRCGSAVGVAVALLDSPSVGRADWLTLASGSKGTTDPAAASEFWFDTPHGPPVVAVTQVTGGDTVQATTGGGTTFFGGLGTPVLLNLADGSAYLAAGNPPAGTTRGPNGGSAGPLASAAPLTGVSIPSGAALLGLALSDLGTDGSRALTVSVTNGAGATLGSGTLAVPDGGWWVIGLGPGQQRVPDPGPIDPPGDGGSGGPPPDPDPTPSPTPGVPEPTTVALAAAALVASGLTTVPPRLRRRRTATNASRGSGS